jgi:diguanylate cyclase (GGDEF)-like protein
MSTALPPTSIPPELLPAAEKTGDTHGLIASGIDLLLSVDNAPASALKDHSLEIMTRGMEKKIWDSIKLGLILLDSDGKITLWNKWLELYSGVSSDNACGQTLDILFPKQIATSFYMAIKNTLLHKFPVVLSNALHRSPLPLFTQPRTPDKFERLQQSITLTPIINDGRVYCLIQVADASISIKREGILKLQSERLSKDVITDSLTGAYNRRFFDERFEVEFSRAHRQNLSFTLIMLDVDYFKAYNDAYGHPAGDKALILIVKTLITLLKRPTDAVVRYGGEEFAILLPDTNSEGGQQVAESLRQAISDLNIPHSHSDIADHITISLGLATYQHATSQHDTHCDSVCFLNTADVALYSAKNSGRNCVKFCTTPDCGKSCLFVGSFFAID